jgi:DNA-directed RNA polymerase subunit N (RpoN/RPB10)
MLFYIRCPSCGRVISYELDKYHDKLSQIINDPNKSKSEKEQMGAELLDEFNFRSMCCRIRIMGLLPYHEIITT